MKSIKVGASGIKAELLPDNEYQKAVQFLCARARRRIFASLFIVDIKTDRDINPFVVELLNDLCNAKKRGVDVRIMIGGSSKNLTIQDITEAAWLYCVEIGIPCRLVTRYRERSSHKKIVVVDDYVILGSHNWSQGAFSGQIQDSIMLQDIRSANYFAYKLNREWIALGKEGK
jgi:phosphatidylserine/phosphatidylglycerophosphate/cardiolipin synthase-like enzyme